MEHDSASAAAHLRSVLLTHKQANNRAVAVREELCSRNKLSTVKFKVGDGREAVFATTLMTICVIMYTHNLEGTLGLSNKMSYSHLMTSGIQKQLKSSGTPVSVTERKHTET